ncbi:MAG: ABC transporter permease [Candidatus Azobacteroides sp.]|nr:ABC transporter permease [Candidatus Azobacteroides sp.]
MYYNLKIALRKLSRGGIYSIINIGGLTIGMAATILIMLWVYNQWSYDRFHEKEKLLYKVWCYDETNGTSDKVPSIIGPTLLDEYAGFTNMTRYMEIEFPFMVNEGNYATTSVEDSKATIATVDSTFLQMFSFPLLQGDKTTALNDPSSIVITESAAKRFFGEKDPMNQTISVNGNLQFTITGILADLPKNTGFNFEVLVPIKRFLTEDSWWVTPLQSVYVELSPKMNGKVASDAIHDIVGKHTGDRLTAKAFLQPASEWNLYSNFEKDKPVGGRIESLRMFSIIALLILFSACVNFMNLSTAQSNKNAKEVGVRKVMGARRYSLINHFLFDSILVTTIAGILAIILVFICLPFFNGLIGENLRLNIGGIRFWLVWLLFILFTGILAGSYPSFYLSSFLPVKVLKGMIKGSKSLVTPRKILIVIQFTLAVILIISTTVIYRQIYHAKTREAGYDRTRLISVMINDYTRPNKELIRQELLNSGVAESVSINFGSMTQSESTLTDVSWKGKDPESKVHIERNYAEADWAKTTGVQIIQGRDIDIRQYPSDSTAMLLNEAAVRIMGFKDPIGEVIREWGKEYHVIGVVKDFVLESPYDPVQPMIIGGPAHNFYNNMNIKLNAHSNMTESLSRIEQIFKKYNSRGLFLYHYADEVYARRFDKEQRIGSLTIWFAGLAIFISCLGLFGLTAYMAENRRKEIGIRKVLGASVIDITLLISKEFLIPVSISIVIAVPVSWWIMQQWLNGYAYRTDLSWWIFAGAAVITIIIALSTVSVQAIKAATANPVKSIKVE